MKIKDYIVNIVIERTYHSGNMVCMVKFHEGSKLMFCIENINQLDHIKYLMNSKESVEIEIKQLILKDDVKSGAW